MGDADIIDEQLARRIRSLPEEMPHLRQAEGERPIGADGDGGNPPRIRLHPARDIDGERRLARRIDLLDQAQCCLAELPLDARAENAVHHRIGKAQRNAQTIPVTVPRKRTDLYAHRPQRAVHRTSRRTETLLCPNEEHLHARAHIDEMSRRSKSVTAVITAARKDSEHLACRAADQLRRLLGRAPPRILHQGSSRQPVALLHCAIDPTHILCKRYVHH